MRIVKALAAYALLGIITYAGALYAFAAIVTSLPIQG